MLPRRLIFPVLLSLALSACGSGTPTVDRSLEESVVRPGITALDQAAGQRCDINASSLRTAIESYRLLEGSPPADEQALVDAGFLSAETPDWDVIDGELVAVDPACAGSATPATVDIVTDIESEEGQADITADDVYTAFDEADIAAVGGADCARELAVIAAAGERFIARTGVEPTSLDDLRDDLEEPVVLWAYDPTLDDLVPAAGSPCIGQDVTEGV